MIGSPLLALSFVHFFFGVTTFLVTGFLILLILVQRGRGGGLTGALGGMGGQSAFGTKAGDTFTRVTMVTATIWILVSIASIKVLSSQDDNWGKDKGRRPGSATPAGAAGGTSGTSGSAEGGSTNTTGGSGEAGSTDTSGSASATGSGDSATGGEGAAVSEASGTTPPAGDSGDSGAAASATPPADSGKETPQPKP